MNLQIFSSNITVILWLCFRVLKFFAVGFGLLLASVSRLSRGRRTTARRNPSPTQIRSCNQKISYARSSKSHKIFIIYIARNQTKPFKQLQMNLAIFRANGGFSQWSLSIKGIPRSAARLTISGWRCCLNDFCQSKNREFSSHRNAKDHWR